MRFGSLIGELHRRSVWQVLGSYAVVAWLILQLAETLEGLIGLPLWFGRVVVVVVLLGFPVLLITAVTQGGKSETATETAKYRDSASGGDDSLSSWAPLEGSFLKNALAQVFTWRNAIVGGVVMAILLALGTAGYSGLRSAGIGPWGSLMASGVFETNENLILSDFEDRTADGTLGETVTALFRIDLGQSTSVHLLDRSELSRPLLRMQRDSTEAVTHQVAMELAQREGVKAIVSGEVLPLGPGAVVSVRLVAAGTGETLVALRETARTIDGVPDAVDRLSAQLRVRIGESLRSIQGDPPLGEVTTGSIDALRKYVQAEWAEDMGDVNTAEALIRESVALDSTFSMAYRKLGVILSNQDRDQEGAREAFVKAFEGRNRLPDRERLLAEAAYHTYVTEKVDSAVQAYEEVLAIFPSDPIAGNNLAVLYGEMGELGKAADLYIRAIERGHAPAVSYTNAVFTLFGAGEADSASVVLDRFRAAYPSHPQAHQYAAAMASARFDYEEAGERARNLLLAQEGNARWEMLAEAELANCALIEGRLEEGLQRVLRAHDLQDQAGIKFFGMSRSAFEALGLASIQLHFLQDPEGAVRILDSAVPGLDEDPAAAEANLEFAVVYAQAGRPDRARERLAARMDPSADSYAVADEEAAGLTFAEAAIALAEGSPEEAIRLYREGREKAPKCTLCGLPELGEAFEAASMPDSAVVRFEEYLEADAIFRSQVDNRGLHRALLGLGRSYEAAGQPERAADYYDWLLDLWSGADPALQTHIREVQGKVRSLRGEPA
jgi:tetratricopeptide (TPR) repeat protein